MKTTKQLFIYGSLLTIFLACKKELEKDAVEPGVTNFRAIPLSGDTILAGKDINISALLSDNEGLGNAVIEIDENYSSHIHGVNASRKWNESRHIQVSGKSYTVNETFSIPANTVPGNYHVFFNVTDEAGNSTKYTAPDFRVENLTRPQVNLVLNGGKVGDTLTFRGQITDDKDLVKLIIKMHVPGYPNSIKLLDREIDLDNLDDKVWDFETDGQLDFVIPASTPVGTYVVKITALDNESNYNAYEQLVDLY
ncbi:DUF4625 domain-containing protein [Owenweeksia hongkongensis]|uniref:DUF4625 domain-containing protein n=1 Tax=Owenweeksia hongkongensis TaxID=253245 RepID=UPI003A8D9B4F